MKKIIFWLNQFLQRIKNFFWRPIKGTTISKDSIYSTATVGPVDDAEEVKKRVDAMLQKKLQSFDKNSQEKIDEINKRVLEFDKNKKDLDALKKEIEAQKTLLVFGLVAIIIMAGSLYQSWQKYLDDVNNIRTRIDAVIDKNSELGQIINNDQNDLSDLKKCVQNFGLTYKCFK